MKEPDDELHDPDVYTFKEHQEPQLMSARSRWPVPSFLPFFSKLRGNGEKVMNEKTPDPSAGALDQGLARIHRRFRAERDNHFGTWRAFMNLGALLLLLLIIIAFL